MKKYLIITFTLLVVFLLNGCNSSLKKATLTVGAERSVVMDNVKYEIEQNTVSKDNLDGKVGKVKKVVTIGSPDPKGYENVKDIYKIKDKDIEDQAAIDWNGSFYLLKPIKE